MKKTTLAWLIILSAGSAASLSLLLLNQPQRMLPQNTCQPSGYGCFVPSIQQLLP